MESATNDQHAEENQIEDKYIKPYVLKQYDFDCSIASCHHDVKVVDPEATLEVHLLGIACFLPYMPLYMNCAKNISESHHL